MDIIVKSQKELDAIPVDTKDNIIIEFGTDESPAIITKRYIYPVKMLGNSSVWAYDNSSVEAYGNSSVWAHDNSSVWAHDNSSVLAYDNSSVRAYGNSSVWAHDNSSVLAHDNSSVRARGNSSVWAYGNNSVEAYDNSLVVAYDNSSVEACDNSSVWAYENSSVEAHGNSSVWAYENSSVEAHGNSSVRARGNSSVWAYGNSSVEAHDNSLVVAYGNVQVIDFLQGSMISVHNNARVVYMPKNIGEFMDFYGIDHDETTAKFFKAVHKKKINDVFEYTSDYDSDFKYEIGKKVISDEFNSDPNEVCGQGIHVSHKNWALNFGKDWSDLAILELKVNIKDIVWPIGSDGKVRVPKAEVIREVSIEECGICGKIIKKKLENQK